jgi:hypothetical protein
MRIRKLKVRVFAPGNKKSSEAIISSTKNRYLKPAEMQAKAEEIKRQVEELLPMEEYRLVKLSSRQYNLVWVSSRLKVGDMIDPVVAEWKAK